MSIESQRSIAEWADWTFGSVAEPRESVRRAAEEMAEFIDQYSEMTAGGALFVKDIGPYQHTILNEAADVVICLFRLASVLRADLLAEVDKKMTINRQRRWKPDGTGNGQHISEQISESEA